ncbi:adenine deaminase [Clostridium botulinum]|nr:adenine deaminase [Clostridium botulinum]
MNKRNFIEQIRAAAKSESCDLVIKNVNVVDVFQNDIFLCDVAVKNGYIVGLGHYDGKIIVDGTNKYICPGLMDAHAHIESSLITPNEYYKVALIHGITSMITDPHEIANVLGVKGIELMMNLSENIPLDFYFMLSSCVPATSFESSGAKLESKDLLPLYNNSKVLGLAEVMNSPAVLNCEQNMINKIWDAKEKGLVIDGHGAGFDETMLNAYVTANITTDHECHNKAEVIDRLRRGMYVLIREGTVGKNFKELIKATSIYNSRRVCFCTDDKHIDDLMKNGSIDNSVKMAINYGLKPETAIQMATLNTAECYNLKDKGAIAPGFVADFIILDSIEEFKINSVYKNGKLVVKNNKLVCEEIKSTDTLKINSSINIPKINKEQFRIDLKDKKQLNVIKIIPNKLESEHLKINVSDLNNTKEFSWDKEKDLIKIAVIERHKGSENIGLGVINGLNIKKGAIATTIAHDSHNLIVAGCNDEDMIVSVNELKNIGGGIVVVKDKEIIASIPLEIGGLITSRSYKEVISDLHKLHEAVEKIAPDIKFNPFLTLSFLSLPVIPSLKITDKGLFDVTKFEFINVAN